MTAFILIGAALLATGVTFVTNWLALNPWRRSKSSHWSEQARLVYPVLVAARANLLSVPCILILSVLLLWPDSSPLWLFTGLVSVLGAYVGTFSLRHEVFPRIPISDLLREAVTSILLRSLIWLVFIAAAVSMPDDFNGLAWAIGATVLALRVVLARGALVWLGRKMGLFVPAPDRLRKIAADTSARMHISYREIWLVRSPVAQAFAIPGRRQLLFTERLLQLLLDDEIASVCAHELAHLTESKTSRYSRAITMLTFMPWIFFNPAIHNFGMAGFFGLCVTTICAPRLYRRISRKLESRADQMAKATEEDAGTYARALTRLYEDNLVPAVTSKERATHPHLYDRILAAGVRPDFERPVPAMAMAWHGHMFVALAGLSFAFFVITKIQMWNPPGGL